jgi:ribose transport system ATP-binding protein
MNTVISDYQAGHAEQKPEMLLSVEDLNKSFPGVQALNRVAFDLYPGEVHALVGENGAGKSTLIKILSGAYKPDNGKINISGKNYRELNPSLAHTLGIRTIYQERSLLTWLSVAENILLGNLPGRQFLVDWNRLNEKANRILQELDLDLDPGVLVRYLGVGKQQSVEIAKALYQQARILIMDEPTSALGRTEVKKLFDTVTKLRSQGIGIIYISHHLDEIFDIADRVTVLRDGSVIETRNIVDTRKEDLIDLMVGRQLSGIKVKEKAEIGEVLLKVKHIRNEPDVLDVSLEVRRGEIVGVAGMVGSGRTELLRLLFGIDRPTNGSITYKGKPFDSINPQFATRQGIALVPEDRKTQGLVLCLDLVDNINIVSMSKGKPVLNRRSLDAETRAQIGVLDIKSPSTRVEVQYLSGGNQQKVVLAKWLEVGAELFIFDEPTQGVDVGAKVEIHRLIVDLAKNGKGILMVSSDLPEVLEISDRILVMRNGQIEDEFAAQEATERMIIECALGERNGGRTE